MPYKDPEVRKIKQREYQQKHYKKKKEYYKTKAKIGKQKILDWYKEYKHTLTCSRCDENHPACLDFHHTDPNRKEFSVSTMASAGYSKERILKEVEKCIVVCANCHRKIHHESNAE